MMFSLGSGEAAARSGGPDGRSPAATAASAVGVFGPATVHAAGDGHGLGPKLDAVRCGPAGGFVGGTDRCDLPANDGVIVVQGLDSALDGDPRILGELEIHGHVSCVGHGKANVLAVNLLSALAQGEKARADNGDSERAASQRKFGAAGQPPPRCAVTVGNS
jgi:hypothetical protein